MRAQLVLKAAAEAPGGTTDLSGPFQRASLVAGMWHGVGKPERLGGRGRAVQAPHPGDNNRWHHSLTRTPLNVRTAWSCKNTLRSGDPAAQAPGARAEAYTGPRKRGLTTFRECSFEWQEMASGPRQPPEGTVPATPKSL